MIAVHQPPLIKNWRHFIIDDSPVLCESGWMKRNRLAARRYPHIFELCAFNEDHLIDILMDVDEDTRPERWRPVGAAGSPLPLAWLPRRSWLEWHLFRGVDPEARRDPIPPALRAAVIARDGYVCGICGGEVEPADVHLDHIRPYSKGGPTTMANLRVTHSVCNIKKGAH